MSAYPELIYHMAHAHDWMAALELGSYAGSPDDKRDGFIHLSSAKQIKKSAAKHRAGQDDLVLVELRGSDLGDALVWEANAPGGMEFPHLYALLDATKVLRSWPLPLDAGGQHIFPEEIEASS